MTLAIIFVFALVSCSSKSNKELEDIPSGQKLELNETTLKITESFEVKEAKNGYVPGANAKVDIEGYSDQLSYFDCVIVFCWNYEYLNDQGEYVPGTYTTTITLTPDGTGSFKGYVEFTNARNIKNVEFSYEYTGYAVRK
mgnify:CR=1 FL=1